LQNHAPAAPGSIADPEEAQQAADKQPPDSHFTCFVVQKLTTPPCRAYSHLQILKNHDKQVPDSSRQWLYVTLAISPSRSCSITADPEEARQAAAALAVPPVLHRPPTQPAVGAGATVLRCAMLRQFASRRSVPVSPSPDWRGAAAGLLTCCHAEQGNCGDMRGSLLLMPSLISSSGACHVSDWRCCAPSDYPACWSPSLLCTPLFPSVKQPTLASHLCVQGNYSDLLVSLSAVYSDLRGDAAPAQTEEGLEVRT
jgi:hypothetical protein